LNAYFDTAYIAKCYVNEPESAAVRALTKTLHGVSSANLCIAEIGAVFHRHAREGRITRAFAKKLFAAFMTDINDGVWTLLPVGEEFLRRVGVKLVDLADDTPMRAADAVHLLSAKENGFDAIWTSDRHMLGAAPSFGLRPKSA